MPEELDGRAHHVGQNAVIAVSPVDSTVDLTQMKQPHPRRSNSALKSKGVESDLAPFSFKETGTPSNQYAANSEANVYDVEG